MGMTQFFEKRKYPFFPHQLFKLSRHIEGSYLFVLPNHDINSIARRFASLLAYRFKHSQHVLRMTILDERACVRHTVEGRLYGHLPFGGKFLLGIVRKKHISAPSIARFNLRLEFVYLHCLSSFLPYRTRHRHLELHHFAARRLPVEAIAHGNTRCRRSKTYRSTRKPYRGTRQDSKSADR